MEDRLLPINALLGLLQPHDLGRPALLDAGFQLAGLEIPAGGASGTVVIDVLLFHPSTNHLLQIEAKSGANVEDSQAVRYGQLRVQEVVQSAYLTLPTRTPPTLETVYLCWAEHADRIQLGLEKLDLTYPIIEVSRDTVGLRRAGAASSQLAGAFAGGMISLGGPPPRLILFDQDSAVEVIKPHVLTALVEAMSHRLPQLIVASLAERATPHYGLYGRAAQSMIRRKVSDAAHQIASEQPKNFAHHPATSKRDGLVRILRTPENNDARGRTQAYQAVARLDTTRERRPKPPWHPGQLDLLAELDAGDNDSEDPELEPDEREEG